MDQMVFEQQGERKREEAYVVASLRPGGTISKGVIGPLRNKRGTQFLGPHMDNKSITRSLNMGSLTNKKVTHPTMGLHMKKKVQSNRPTRSLGESARASRKKRQEDNVHFLQLNMNKSKICMVEVDKCTFDIALVQEPNIYKGRLSMISPPKRSFHKGGRAAIIIGEGMSYWPVEALSDEDVAVIALNRAEGQVFFGLIYLDILKDPIQIRLGKVVECCSRKKIPLILGIDTNAHSTTWGCESSNPRGETLEEWIIQKDLFVHNVGNKPTFAPNRDVRHTIIDITITNRWALEWVYLNGQ